MGGWLDNLRRLLGWKAAAASVTPPAHPYHVCLTGKGTNHVPLTGQGHYYVSLTGRASRC